MTTNNLLDHAAYTFFDVESSGLFDFSKALDDPSQPKILTIAMLLCDENEREIMSFKTAIKHEGFVIDERLTGDDGKPTAFSVNRVGNDMVNRYGIQLRQALGMFKAFEQRS